MLGNQIINDLLTRSVVLLHQPDKLFIAHGFASHRLTDGGKHLRAVHVAQPLLAVIC